MAFNMGSAILWLKGDDSDLNKKLKRSKSGLASFVADGRKALNTFGKYLIRFGIVAAGAMGVAVKSAVDFDTAMREVNTLLGLSEGEFQALKDQVIDFSGRLGIDAVEAAQALYQAISAGVPAENVFAFMEVAAKAAIGGVTDIKTAVDGLTTVVNAFGMDISEVGHASDVMFETMKGGKTTIGELSAYLFQIASVAKNAGVSLEEVGAGMVALTKQGVPTSEAATSLRQAILSVIAPGEALAKIYEANGIASGEALIKARGLGGAFAFVKEQAADTGELKNLLGRVQGLDAVLKTTGSSGEMFATALEDMNNAAGASDAAFEIMENSVGRRFQRMWVSIKNLSIEFGEVLLPVIEDLAVRVMPWLGDKMQWLRDHQQEIIDKTREWGDKLYDFATRVGPIVVDVIKKITWVVQKSAEGLGIMIARLEEASALAGKLSGQGAPWWLLAAGATPIGAAIIGAQADQPGMVYGMQSTGPGPMGSGIVFSGAMYVRQESDITRIASELANLLEQKQRARGIMVGA